MQKNQQDRQTKENIDYKWHREKKMVGIEPKQKKDINFVQNVQKKSGQTNSFKTGKRNQGDVPNVKNVCQALPK